MTARTRLTRRLAIGALAMAAAAVLAVRELRLLPRHAYKKSQYDDLLSLLDDRDAAARFGRPLLKPSFEAAAAATVVRRELRDQTLRNLAVQEAWHGQVFEMAGWIVPQSLALLCALAAAEA